MSMDRRKLLRTAGIVSIATLAGCASDDNQPNETETGTDTPTPNTDTETPSPETPTPNSGAETPTPEPTTETPTPETDTETPTPEPTTEDVRVQRADQLFKEADWLLNGFESTKQQYASLHSSLESKKKHIKETNITELSQSDIDELHSRFTTLYDFIDRVFGQHYTGDSYTGYGGKYNYAEEIDLSEEVTNMKRFIQLKDRNKFNGPFNTYVSRIDEVVTDPSKLKRGGGVSLGGENNYAQIRKQLRRDTANVSMFGLGVHQLFYHTSTVRGDPKFHMTFENGENDFKNGSEYSYEEGTIESGGYTDNFPDGSRVLTAIFRKTGNGGNPNSIQFEVQWFHGHRIIQLESEADAEEMIQNHVTSYKQKQDGVYDGTTELDKIGTAHKFANVNQNGNIYYYMHQFKNYVVSFGFGERVWDEKPIPTTWLTRSE